MGPARATILLVEPDEATERFFTEVLGSEGFGTVIAGRGSEAIDRLQEVNPASY